MQVRAVKKLLALYEKAVNEGASEKSPKLKVSHFKTTT